jgi:probable HAF family extracellular repeat protein
MKLLKKSVFILATVVFFFCHVVLEAFTLKHMVVDLGTLESDESVAYAINDFDQVVGTYKLNGTSYVFLWSQKEGVSFVDLPISSTPKVINNNKQIAGQYKENGFERGFFYDPVTGFCDIGSLGGANTWVMDMNAKGQVVGYSETGNLSHLRNSTKEIHAFIWFEGAMNDLGVLHGGIGLGGDESVAVGISDHGDIVGYSNYTLVYKGKTLSSVYKGVSWKNGPAEELFPETQPSYFSKALSISRDGKITLVRQIESNRFESLMYDPLTKNIKLFGTSSGGPPHGVIKNNDKDVIIHSYLGHCIVSKQESGGYNGIQIIPSNPFWNKFEVFYGINNANKMVGKAKSMYGECHAVLVILE